MADIPEDAGPNSTRHGSSVFSTFSNPIYFDGLLPITSLSIDIVGLNRNASCENIVFLVPVDFELARWVDRRKGATSEQLTPRAKRQKLDEKTMLEDEESNENSEAREEHVGNSEGGSEEEAASWSDGEKEEIAFLSLARYLSVQSCLSPAEEQELHTMFSFYYDGGESQEAAGHSLQTQHSFADSEESQQGAPRRSFTLDDVRRWVGKTLSGLRLVFLMELYAAPGPHRVIENVVTALFPPTPLKDNEDQSNGE